MGKFGVDINPDFLKQLGRLADIEKIAPKMIDQSMPLLEKHVKAEIGKHNRTGNMQKSVKSTKAKRNKKNGWYAVTRPTGTTSEYKDDNGKIHKRKKPYRNMEILAYLEYGTSEIAPKPILSKAINDSKPEIEDKMREVFKEEIKK